ncbi:hypothetical protein AB6A40_006072 [Gnathostoma spinigerum]|uniref:BTB/POZ domain-containing protein KCTD3 n=1 Tax=Gnathostoma spinigerum TaxID=75299 RepID=A0ABD6EQS7_9BILA
MLKKIYFLVPSKTKYFRLCTIRSVDGSAVSAFLVHECEGSSRMGARPRRYLFTGTSNGTIQMWDLTTALDQYHARISASSGQSSAIEKSPSGNSSASASHASSPSSNLWNHPISSSTLQGPTPEELLQLIDECEICCTSLNSTPNSTPRASVMHLPELDVQRQS